MTLSELLITLCLVAIMAALAVPGWEYLRASQQASADVNHVLRMVAITRAQAVILREPITLCASRDRRTCGGEWSEGQVVKSARAVLQTFPAMSSSAQLTWKGVGGASRIIFFPNGATQNGKFHYCGKKDPCVWIIVNRTGRARVEKE